MGINEIFVLCHSFFVHLHIFRLVLIVNYLDEQGTGYEFSISIDLTKGARHLKEHPKVSKFAKFESYWFKLKGMVEGQLCLQSIPSSLMLAILRSVPCLCI